MAKAKKTKGTRAGRSRRGKGENMTGAKESAVEMRTIGDNSGELNLQQVQIDDGDFDLHYKAIKSAVERQKQSKNLYDGCCKAAKKVSADLLEAVKKAIKFDGMDPDDIKRQLEIDGYALKRRENPIQLTVFNSLLGDQKEVVAKRGYEDGKAGRSAKTEYPEGSDLATIYSENYMRGQGEVLGLDAEETSAAINANGSEAAAVH
jgi:hypothetical protein